MTSTDRLVAGVIAALFAPGARLNEMNAAFGVVILCVAFATTIEVMMATTVAMRMTPGRENFWIRIVIAFIVFGFLLCWFSYVWFSMGCDCLASVLQGTSFLFSRRVGKTAQETGQKTILPPGAGQGQRVATLRRECEARTVQL